MSCQTIFWNGRECTPVRCFANRSFPVFGQAVIDWYITLAILAAFLLPAAASASLVIFIEGTPGESTSTIRISSTDNTLTWGGTSVGTEDSASSSGSTQSLAGESSRLTVENYDTSGAPSGTTAYERVYEYQDEDAGSWISVSSASFAPFAASEDFALTLEQGISTSNSAILTTFDDAGTDARTITFTPGTSTINVGIDDFNEGTWQWTSGSSETITLSVSAVPEPSPLFSLIPLLGGIFLWRWFTSRKQVVAVPAPE